jgi:hypothetical protein
MFYFRVKSQFVDLPEDFKVDLIIENPLFLQDRIPVPYTTTSEFPLTPANRKLLDHPDRVNVDERIWEYDHCIMGYGVRVLYRGLMIIQEIGGRLTWNFQASDDLSIVKSNMNDIDWGQIDFGSGNRLARTEPQWEEEFPYGPDCTGYVRPVDEVATSYKEHWESARDDEQDYTIGTIKSSQDDIPLFFESENSKTYLHTLFAQNQFFNAAPYTIDITRPDIMLSPVGFREDDCDGTITEQIVVLSHGVVFPQLRVYHVMKKLLNLTDARNPFASPLLRKLVLTSHYHPNFIDNIMTGWAGILLDSPYPPLSLATPDPWYVRLASYQPALSAAVIVKSMLNLVGGTLFRVQKANESYFEIKLVKQLIEDPSFANWEKYLGTNLVLSREMAQAYNYGYAGTEEDKAPIDPEYVVTTIQALVNAPVNPATKQQMYYVQTTGQTILKKLSYKVEETDPDVFTYEVINSGFVAASDDQGYNIKSDIVPMGMKPTLNADVFYPDDQPRANLAYLPIYEGTRSKAYRPHVMIYWGHLPNPLATNGKIPHLSYHNYDAAGNRLGDLSLVWDGPDGLLERFHKPFKDWLEQDRLTAYGEFVFSPYMLKDFDISQKVLVRSKLWWVKKIQIGLTRKKIDPARVDLIEAPAVPASTSGGSSSSTEGSSPPPPPPPPVFSQFTIFWNTSTSPNQYGWDSSSLACAGTGAPLTVYINGTATSLVDAVVTQGKSLYKDSAKTQLLNGNNTWFKTASGANQGGKFQVGTAGDVFNFSSSC